MKKNPTFLVATDRVNETQRKSLGLGHYVPTPRHPMAAGPRDYVANGPYVPEKGAYYRNDGNKHIKTLGIEST